MVTKDTRLSVFSITASSLNWHFSQENSIQKEILAPRWSQIVAPSHMPPMGPAGVHQRLPGMAAAKRFPSPPQETGTLSPITHYWTATFVKLHRAAAWRGGVDPWRGVRGTPSSSSNLFVFLWVLLWLTRSALAQTWSTVDELFMLSSAHWFKIHGKKKKKTGARKCCCLWKRFNKRRFSQGHVEFWAFISIPNVFNMKRGKSRNDPGTRFLPPTAAGSCILWSAQMSWI